MSGSVVARVKIEDEGTDLSKVEYVAVEATVSSINGAAVNVTVDVFRGLQVSSSSPTSVSNLPCNSEIIKEQLHKLQKQIK